MDILKELKDLIIGAEKAYFDYLKVKEQDATEREFQIARIKALTISIKEQRSFAEAYAGRLFAERKKLREMADRALDKAIETGDAELAGLTLQLIEYEYEKDLFGKMNRVL
ncbi:MAG: hypothetical protein LRY71_18325 [Bacillaceae bacterium]|nr:hypothetical protein [Bacillaceae bacterium]